MSSHDHKITLYTSLTFEVCRERREIWIADVFTPPTFSHHDVNDSTQVHKPTLYTYLMIHGDGARVVMSFLPCDCHQQKGNWQQKLNEPILKDLRRLSVNFLNSIQSSGYDL